MIDSYKNVERLRYRLNNDLSEIKYAIDKNTNTWLEEMVVQVSSAVISAMAAGVITDNSFSNLQNALESWLNNHSISVFDSLLSWLLTVLCFLLVYVLIFIAISKLIKKFQIVINNGEINKQVYKNYQKEFENIFEEIIIFF